MRWTRPETWHLTLLFLGAVAPDRVTELERLVDVAAAAGGPYRAAVNLGDGRARHKEGVGWLGLSRGAGTLIETATLVAERCPDDITEGPPPKRTPSAHLTVVRQADGAVIGALREHSQGPLGIDWTIDRIHLMRSHLDPAGARYETLHEATM